MKNYIIGALIAIIIALSSFLYKYSVNGTSNTLSVPLSKEEIKTDGTPKLLLLVFFSRKNCSDCLGIIDVLNNMPSSQFIVRGVIPDNELESIEEVKAFIGLPRNSTGTVFSSITVFLFPFVYPVQCFPIAYGTGSHQDIQCPRGNLSFFGFFRHFN